MLVANIVRIRCPGLRSLTILFLCMWHQTSLCSSSFKLYIPSVCNHRLMENKRLILLSTRSILTINISCLSNVVHNVSHLLELSPSSGSILCSVKCLRTSGMQNCFQMRGLDTIYIISTNPGQRCLCAGHDRAC